MSSRTLLDIGNRKSNLIDLSQKRKFVSSRTEKLRVDSFRDSWILGLILPGSRSKKKSLYFSWEHVLGCIGYLSGSQFSHLLIVCVGGVGGVGQWSFSHKVAAKVK